MTRRLSILAALIMAAATSAPGAASATPITPGTTPLWMQVEDADLPLGCPAASDLDGTGTIAAVQGVAKRRRAELILTAAVFDGLLAKPTVVACDPALVARRVFLGGITGESALTMQDRVFWGERSLLGSAPEGPAGLRSGDRLTFPPLGATASVDLTVAAGDATTSLRLPPSTDPPTSARVVGTTAAPSVLVTRASGNEQSVPVAVPAPNTYRVRWSRRGNRVTARIRGTAGVLATVVASNDATAAAVIGERGEASLRLTVPRKKTSLFVLAYDPRTRAARITTCSTRSGAPVRCGTVRTKLDSVFDALLGPEFLRSRAARAVRSAITPHARRPGARAHQAVPSPLLVRAARAKRTARATITRIDRMPDSAGEFALSPGDLNGDGRPDAITSPYESTSRLRISTGDRTWRSVRVKGAGAPAADLDGDGRGELVTDREDVLVTDAFAAGPLPSVVDLSRRRHPRPRDLVLGGSELDLSLAAGVPGGALSDTTGDRRPELVIADSAVVVLPSEAFAYGRAANLADVFPTLLVRANELAAALDDDEERSNGQRDQLASIVDDGRLFTAAPRDRKAVDETARPIDLDERATADGAVRARRTFNAAGWPTVSDLDARTGDALVVMEPTKGCQEEDEFNLGELPSIDELRSQAQSCKRQVLRVDASGRIVATISATGSPDERLSAVFAADGSDADTALEVLVSSEGYLNPGELRLASSSTAGSVRLARLPAVDLGRGRADDLVGDLSVVVLPNGTRWPAIATVPVTRDERRSPPSELLLVQPK